MSIPATFSTSTVAQPTIARHMVAIDLGASSGRVMLASYLPGQQQLTLREVCRFTNQIKSIDGSDVWDIDAIEQAIRGGLNQLDSEGIRLDSIGIDTWGVDFVLLDKQGERVGLPVSYRDSRTQGVMEQAQQTLGSDMIYRRTGIQFLPFNTLYQLRALSEQQPHLLAKVAHLLLIPDYLHYRLTGQLNWEYTNATTTQLLNIETGDWDSDLLAYAGIPPHWFGKPSKPGNTIGYWQSHRGQQVPVIAVATHDTASAVLAAPLMDTDAAYLSSGTWSLMGFESRLPLTHCQAQSSNITNEGGAEARYRVLKNIMGLWLLQRAVDELHIDDLPELIEQAAKQPACRSLINPNDSRFINPPNMCREIQNACREHGLPVPITAAQLTRCIFDSLAMLYRQVAQELAELRGRPISHLHIVGGGCQNQFLNQLCADACGLPVSMGPIEASTLGNIGSQLISLGEVADVAHYRRIVAKNFPMHALSPHDNTDFAAHWSQFQSLSQLPKELCI
ncbi:rhamnulokinase [Yersinia frederiksenii]|jgi:rhamnulokinase|uniref:Rhamnulokinase n=2 Tax=Yersinia TaxID=629 RepID=A0AAI8ZMT4_YERFR|nr:rhamnulokinase [Yersinia frederiksenii]CFR28646.1 rhamnulokinase [Yersinia frederiksenii]CQH14699.1 rhamnulokinase [Yersinia frederiksenii]